MGSLWAYTGAIGCMVLNPPYKFQLAYGETMTHMHVTDWYRINSGSIAFVVWVGGVLVFVYLYLSHVKHASNNQCCSKS